MVPDLDGFGGHPQAAGHLGQGEHAGVTEPLLAAAQPVFVADVADDEAVERAAFAAGQAAVVEDAGDLGVGVVIEELIDGGDDGGGGLAELRGVRRDGQGEGGVLACGQADVRGDGVAGPGDGDVGEQQPGDALAFAGGGGGVVPDRGQVGDQLADPGFLRVGELPGVVLAGLLAGVLGLAEGAQGGVPVGFEGVGDEAVGGVDGEVAAAGQVGVVAGAFDVGGAQRIGLVGTVLELGLDGEGDLGGQRGEGVDALLARRFGWSSRFGSVEPVGLVEVLIEHLQDLSRPEGRSHPGP